MPASSISLMRSASVEQALLQRGDAHLRPALLELAGELLIPVVFFEGDDFHGEILTPVVNSRARGGDDVRKVACSRPDRARRAVRGCAAVSIQTGAHHRAVRAGRRFGLHRALDGAKAHRTLRAVVYRRKPRGRGRQPWRRARAEGAARRLHAASHLGDYTVNPSVYKLSFDPIKDIAPVIQISGGPYVVAVHPSVPAKTLAEFVNYARAAEKLAYGSSGNGSVMHVSTAYFLDSAKIKVLRAVQRHGPRASGHARRPGAAHLRRGAHHAAARQSRQAARPCVTTQKRIAAAPELPTIAESGYPV